MKTYCPHCHTKQKIPEVYEGKMVKCRHCKQLFKALKHRSAKVALVDAVPAENSRTVPVEVVRLKKVMVSKENPFVYLWTKSPKAFKTGFLATLGVLSALWVAWHVGWMSHRLTQPKPTRAIQPHRNAVILMVQDFEQAQEVPPGQSGPDREWVIKWRAWVHNSHPYPVNGSYLVELRDCEGFLLDSVVIEAIFPPTSGSGIPPETNGLYWPSRDVFLNADFTKSKIYIRLEDY